MKVRGEFEGAREKETQNKKKREKVKSWWKAQRLFSVKSCETKTTNKQTFKEWKNREIE